MKKILLLSIGLFCMKTATSQVTVSGPTMTYPTLNDAFVAINAGTHTGAITIDISASTTETTTAILNSSGFGSANYTSVLIFPSVDGVAINGSTTTATGRGVIELNGADNVTIDGDNPNTAGINRNLTIINGNSNTTGYTSVIRVATDVAAPFDNANNNTVKNVILNGNATGRNAVGVTSTTGSENTTFGVVVGPNGGAAPAALTSVTGAMAAATTANNFAITNCAINQAARGIAFLGNTTTASSNSVTITNNTIGAAAALTGIPPYLTPATTIYTKATFLQGITAVNVTGNTIQNIMSFVGTSISGVELSSNIGPGAVAVSNNTITGIVLNNNGSSNASRAISLLSVSGTYTVSNNIVSNVQGFSGSSTSKPSGIYLSTAATSGLVSKNSVSTVINRNTGTWGCSGIQVASGNNVTLINNTIWDINSDMTSGFGFSPSWCPLGMVISAGTGHKVYHNSIHLSGTLIGTAASDLLSAAFCIVSASSTGMDVRNNIFSNTLSGGTTNLANVSIYLPSGATSAMNLILNNNAYYCASTAASHGIGQVGNIVGTGFYLASNFSASAVTPANNLRAYTSTLGNTTNDDKGYANSVATPFISNTNLHINNAAISPLESTGVSTLITSVTTDIDNDQRPGPVPSVNGGGTAPDMGADEFDGFPVPACAGAPAASSVTAPNTTLCAGANITMSLSVTYTLPGIAYQWQNSPTLAGTYTNIPGAINAAYTATNQTATSFYQAVITCTNGPASTTATALQVVVNPLPAIVTSPTSTSVCIPGSTVVALNASGASTYTWSPMASLSSSVGASVNASPAATTVYSVTGTSSLGCINVATATVVTNIGLNMDSVGVNPTAICAGNSATLMAYASTPTLNFCQPVYSTGSGLGDYISSVVLSTLTNTSGALASPFYTLHPQSVTTTTLVAGSTYSLYLQAGTYSDNDVAGWIDFNQNGILNDIIEKLGETDGLGAGPATATLVFTVPLNALNGTTRFRVRDMDHVGINDMDPCASQSSWGETEDYIVTITGGINPSTSYSWTPSTFLSSTSTQSTIANTATATTLYSVTATYYNGCAVTGAKTLTVNPLPVVAITGNTAICSGNAAVLTATGAATYSWNTTATTSTVSVSPTTNTVYSVSGTNAGNCSNTATFALTVNTTPTVNATTSASLICNGSPAVLTATGATTYSWNTTATTSTISVTPSVTTSYTVTGTTNGCSNAFVISQAVSPCTGIDTKAATVSGILVYPNPNTGEFTIELNNGSVKTIDVMDLTGRVIISDTSSNDKVDFNINTLANGVYYVKIQSNNSIEVIKIVKQ